MKFIKIEEKNSIAEKLKYPVMNAKYDLGFSFLIENAMNIDITSINVCRFLEILFGYFYFMCVFCVLCFEFLLFYWKDYLDELGSDGKCQQEFELNSFVDFSNKANAF